MSQPGILQKKGIKIVIRNSLSKPDIPEVSKLQNEIFHLKQSLVLQDRYREMEDVNYNNIIARYRNIIGDYKQRIEILFICLLMAVITSITLYVNSSNDVEKEELLTQVIFLKMENKKLGKQVQNYLTPTEEDIKKIVQSKASKEDNELESNSLDFITLADLDEIKNHYDNLKVHLKNGGIISDGEVQIKIKKGEGIFMRGVNPSGFNDKFRQSTTKGITFFMNTYFKLDIDYSNQEYIFDYLSKVYKFKVVK